MPLSEPMYCVAIAFKMTEHVEQQNCIKFCVKLEHSSVETIWMIQKAAGELPQCTLSCSTSCAGFFDETSNHPGDSAPLQPKFGTLRLLALPKTKITFEREEISERR